MSPLQILNFFFLAFVSPVSFPLFVSSLQLLFFCFFLRHLLRHLLNGAIQQPRCTVAGPDNIVCWLKTWRETPRTFCWINIEGVTEIPPPYPVNNGTSEDVNCGFFLLSQWHLLWEERPPPAPAPTSASPMHSDINNPPCFTIPFRNLHC